MVIGSIEIKEIIFEVEQDRLEEVVKKIKELILGVDFIQKTQLVNI